MTPAGGSVSWPTAETIAGLEARKLEYLLGARERSDALVKTIVLANDDPFADKVGCPKSHLAAA